jgi:hypothetical protein
MAHTATTPATPEHIAFALWPTRRKYRALHGKEFADEVSLLVAVKTDMQLRNFHDLPGAVSFYRDLNISMMEPA